MAMPKKKKKGGEAEEANPVFEVPAEEKIFKGDPNDRKALLRHKQRVKACSSALWLLAPLRYPASWSGSWRGSPSRTHSSHYDLFLARNRQRGFSTPCRASLDI